MALRLSKEEFALMKDNISSEISYFNNVISLFQYLCNDTNIMRRNIVKILDEKLAKCNKKAKICIVNKIVLKFSFEYDSHVQVHKVDLHYDENGDIQINELSRQIGLLIKGLKEKLSSCINAIDSYDKYDNIEQKVEKVMNIYEKVLPDFLKKYSFDYNKDDPYG